MLMAIFAASNDLPHTGDYVYHRLLGLALKQLLGNIGVHIDLEN